MNIYIHDSMTIEKVTTRYFILILLVKNDGGLTKKKRENEQLQPHIIAVECSPFECVVMCRLRKEEMSTAKCLW